MRGSKTSPARGSALASGGHVTAAWITAAATLSAAWLTASATARPRAVLTPPSDSRPTADTSAGARPPGGRTVPRSDPRLPLFASGPASLLAQLRSCAPLQRRRVAETLFVGRWVRWTGRVTQIVEAGPGITVAFRGADGARAVLEYPNPRRAEIESLRVGDRLHVNARVHAVLDSAVALDSPMVSQGGVQRFP